VRRNPSSLRWLDNLATFVLLSIASKMSLDDFDEARDFAVQ
jgi:hypothetical protein